MTQYVPDYCVSNYWQGGRDSNHILDEVPEDNLNAGAQELTTEELVEEKQQVRQATRQ
jgi:hypothetical protein